MLVEWMKEITQFRVGDAVAIDRRIMSGTANKSTGFNLIFKNEFGLKTAVAIAF